jgi:hypothetical protein
MVAFYWGTQQAFSLIQSRPPAIGNADSRFRREADMPRASGARRSGENDPKPTPAIRHSITSSARASSIGGMSNPIALAVLRLITSSKAVGCSTGS